MPTLRAASWVAVRLLVAACGALPVAFAQSPATYFVRPDGGTGKQCTGKADAAYSGKGSNQPCAWSEPAWALKTPVQWKLAGGDRLLIAPGSYRMGRGGRKSAWDLFSEDEFGSWLVFLPPLPSGPNAATPTVLAGTEYQSGCQHKPELWGSRATQHILDLSGTSNALVACLEITDHAQCGAEHPTLGCGPLAESAGSGILAKDEHGEGLTLRDLDIHGLMSSGIHGYFASVTLDHVTLAGNGASGWNGDLGDHVRFATNVRMSNSLVEWNGCVEDPRTRQPAASGCYGELEGGYGDGVGMPGHTGTWTVTQSTFRYNTQDGLDLLYLGGAGSQMVVDGSTAYGNAGNQMKGHGQITFTNNLVVSNCSFFDGKPFSLLKGYFSEDAKEFHTAGNCRANGDGVVFSVPAGSHSRIVNNTIVGEGDFLMWLECDTPGQACGGSTGMEIANNILRGYRRAGEFRDQEIGRRGELVGSLFLGGGLAWSVHHNLLFHLDVGYDSRMPGQAVSPSGFAHLKDGCPMGPGDVCADPLFVRDVLAEDFDGHLRDGSPALHAGASLGVTSDHDGHARPSGAGAIGAFEATEGKR